MGGGDFEVLKGIPLFIIIYCIRIPGQKKYSDFIQGREDITVNFFIHSSHQVTSTTFGVVSDLFTLDSIIFNCTQVTEQIRSSSILICFCCSQIEKADVS